MARDTETLLTGRRFRVVRAEYEDADGRTHVREIVRHPGAVVIVPRLDDGRVCLIRNYRAAVDETLIDLERPPRDKLSEGIGLIDEL